MPEGPYRPAPPPPDAELARLAAEGERRTLDAHANGSATQRGAADERNREKNVRVALGGHYGSPIGTGLNVLLALAVGLVAVCVWDVELAGLSVPLLFGAIFARAFVPTVSTRARVDAERAWASSLPFPMDGYFEVLGGSPQKACVLTATLAWDDPRLSPNEGTLRGLVGQLDTGATAELRGGGTAVLRSGRIVDRAWVRVNRAYYVHRNTPLVGYAHRLVDQVLLPLHRSHRIARVSLTRS